MCCMRLRQVQMQINKAFVSQKIAEFAAMLSPGFFSLYVAFYPSSGIKTLV